MVSRLQIIIVRCLFQEAMAKIELAILQRAGACKRTESAHVASAGRSVALLIAGCASLFKRLRSPETAHL